MKPLLPILSVLLLAGCHDDSNKSVSKTTTIGPVQATTIEYDGHKIIVLKGYLESSALHHPDCPCGKTKQD